MPEFSTASTRKCRVCGCTEESACVNADGETCSWVLADLCSACASDEEILASNPEIFVEATFRAALTARIEETGAPITQDQGDLAAWFFGKGIEVGSALGGTITIEEAGSDTKILLPGEDF